MADDPASPDATPAPVPREDEEEDAARGQEEQQQDEEEDDQQQPFATGATGTPAAGAYDEGDEADAPPEQSEFEALKQVRRSQGPAVAAPLARPTRAKQRAR
jgi:hypothetical protein